MWLCQCKCGTKRPVVGENLRAGRSVSCGCYNREVSRAVNTTHGMTKTRLYECWLDMKKRCNDANNKEYKNYGGRGITYCEEWEEFEPFQDWAERTGYQDTLTLDRVDVNEGYFPENCKWSTWVEQSRNKRLNTRNKYGVSGVNFDKKRKVYIVRIGVNGIRKFIGSYKTLEEAKQARLDAEKMYWG